MSSNKFDITESINKNKVFIFINFVIIFITYDIFLNMHFSLDSYAVYFDMDAPNQLRQSRFMNYIFIRLFELMGINTCRSQVLLTFIFMLMSALSASIITNILDKSFNGLSIKKYIAVDFAVLITFVNVFILEWYLYPEITLFYGLSLVFSVLALLILYKNTGFLSCLISGVCVFISLNFYQASMPLFVVYGLMIVAVKNKLTINYKSFKETVSVILVGGVSSVFMLIVQKIAISVGITGGGDRDAKLGLEIVLSNCIQVIKLQKKVWEGFEFLPSWLLPVFALVAFITFIYFSRGKLKINNYVYYFVLLMISYIIIFAPHFVTETIWLVPRTIIAIGAFFSAMVVCVIFVVDNRAVRYSIIISVVFLIMNGIQIKKVALNHLKSNSLDEEYSIIIQNEIEKYETINNIKIKNIAAVNDISPKYNYEGIEYAPPSSDTNIRAFVVPWAQVNIINYYNNTDYKQVEMNEEIYGKFFADKDWDSFIPEEQMVFDGDTLNIAYY